MELAMKPAVMRPFALGCFCLIALILVRFAPAQIGGGSIVGFVTDQSKAVVPGADVKATNIDTNVVTTTVTNNDGYYEFPLLPAGNYSVETSHGGFRTVRSANFRLSTSTQPRVDLTMEVGSTSSTVEVTTQEPLLNVTRPDLGEVIGSQKVENLPLNGRNWQQLVNLQPGANASPSNTVGARGGMSFNGSPGYGNQLFLDGVDMSFGEIDSSGTDQAAGAGTSLIGGVSIAAISEVKIDSSSFSAEYGNATGGVVNLTSKSGANQFHGEAFEFFRNDILNANDFFSKRNHLTKPPLRWNQFGANLGGPIKRNKLFFFFNYEGARVYRNTQLSGNTPTPLLLSQLTPALEENASGLPSSFTPTTNPLLGFSVRNASAVDIENTTLSRVDYTLGRQRLAVRYSYNWSNYMTPEFRPANVQSAPYHFNNVVAEHTFAFTPTTLNEFRFGYNRNNLNRLTSTLNVLPGWFEVDSVGLVGDFQSQIHYITNTFTVTDNLTMIRGPHTFKTGFYMYRLASARQQDTGMTTYYNSLADLISDKANTVRVTFNTPKALASWNYGFYGQDDWRINQQLQVNLGLRYDYFTPMVGAFSLATSDPFGPFIGSTRQRMWASNFGNVGPRVGVIWSPVAAQKLVVRAGAGISYMQTQPFFLYDFGFIDPLIPFSLTLAPTDVPAGFSLAFPFPQTTFTQEIVADPQKILELGIAPSRTVADHHLPDGAAGQWNLSVQYALTPNLALQTSYVGNHASHLYYNTLPNQFLPHKGPRPDPTFSTIQLAQNVATSSYNALQVSLNERNYHGLVVDAYYTWGKTLSYGTANDTNNIGSNNVQDLNNVAASYGVVDGDIRNIFTVDHSYLLPAPGFAQRSYLGKSTLGGWSLEGIFSYRSGLPMNITSGLDLVRNQRITGDRPNIVPGVSPYVKNGGTLQWLTPTAFDNQTPYNAQVYGNAGYNSLFGPRGLTYDAAVHKAFPITETSSLTFRGEAFNVLNHVVLANPTTTLTNPQFGFITSGSSGRAYQLALTFAF
jgi:hypothetical protein